MEKLSDYELVEIFDYLDEEDLKKLAYVSTR